MLSFSKRVDYALIALAFLAERPGRIAPARQIALAYDLPLPLLMNILKELHQHGLVRGLRGTKGGYQIAVDPAAVTLHDLIVMLEGPVQTTECVPLEPARPCSCDDGVALRGLASHAHSSTPPSACECRISKLCPVRAPLKALNDRLVQFLREVRLADIVGPAARVDVPVENIGVDR